MYYLHTVCKSAHVNGAIDQLSTGYCVIQPGRICFIPSLQVLSGDRQPVNGHEMICHTHVTRHPLTNDMTVIYLFTQ